MNFTTAQSHDSSHVGHNNKQNSIGRYKTTDVFVVVDKAAKAAMSSCTNDVAVATYPSFISL
jgi:hypothetical protein